MMPTAIHHHLFLKSSTKMFYMQLKINLNVNSFMALFDNLVKMGCGID